MFKTLIIFLLISKSLAQNDGQFWWLNSKLDTFREPPPQPKFENLSDFDTDESAKIVFRDDDLLSKDKKFAGLKVDQDEILDGVKKLNQAIKFEDKSEMVLLSNFDITKEAMTLTPASTTERQNSDIFALKFPDHNFLFRDKEIIGVNKVSPVKTDSNITNTYKETGNITYLINIVPSKAYKNRPSDSESICTTMKKSVCSRIGGIVYVTYKSDRKRGPFDSRLICCVLPIRSELQSSKIYFPDTPKPCYRKHCKRTERDTSTAMKQRNALILRKFGSQAHKLKLSTPNSAISQRVVTPTYSPTSDEYIDPYWNVKSNVKKPRKHGNQFQQTTKYDYDEDYVEDYVVELPKPGLTGLYSDHGPTKPGWAFPTTRPNYGVIDSDEVDDEPAFGYAPTVDPRLEDRRGTSSPHISGRPIKLSTYSDKKKYDAESQSINYQSNPDFQVLQDFKLLNLVQNRSRIHRNGKKTTTERIFDSTSREQVLTASLESNYDEGSSDNEHFFKKCGRVVKGLNRNYGRGKEIGDTERGAHPSLALVVLTKRRQTFLCYGTIVHPRAAVTAADCVFGRTGPGEITVIAGAWHLDEEGSEEWQKRMATVHIHSQYRPGDLADNLALLHWKRSLRLDGNVQPACLSDPHVGDDCKFFGWGGYDQAIRKQSRWQQAQILAPRTCKEQVTGKRLPSEAFCASVQSRGSVTGLGGALICSVGGRQSATGVAVWRDLAVVLIPALQWVTNALEDLQLE